MILSIDIDDTTTDFNSEIKPCAIEYDKSLRNTGIIDESKYYINGRYDWSESEVNQFINKHFEELTLAAKIKPFAREVIRDIRKRGHYIIIGTARSEKFFKDPLGITVRQLKEEDIEYDKLIIRAGQKIDMFIENNVQVTYDDLFSICSKASNIGIHSFLAESEFNQKFHNSKVKKVDWPEFYNQILLLEDIL